jgi:hypothetical protein
MPILLTKAYVSEANASVESGTAGTAGHFAMYIEFYDGSATLLPIALHLLISHPLPYVEAPGPGGECFP